MAPVVFEGVTLPRLRGGWLCLDFANTVDYDNAPGEEDYLISYLMLARWAQYVGILTGEQTERLLRMAEAAPAEAAVVLQRARVLREAITTIFSAIAEDAPVTQDVLAVLNAELANAMAYAGIHRTDEGFAWDWSGAGETLDRMLWVVARSAADLLTSSSLDRVRRCPNETCGWLFLDTSKNGSRRWCSMDSCGNVMKQRRHQHKLRTAN